VLFVEQIKAARMLLDWDQHKLAQKAGVSLGTIKRLEATPGVIGGTMETVMKIRHALEVAGVIFISADNEGGTGVRLAKPKR